MTNGRHVVVTVEAPVLTRLLAEAEALLMDLHSAEAARVAKGGSQVGRLPAALAGGAALAAVYRVSSMLLEQLQLHPGPGATHNADKSVRLAAADLDLLRAAASELACPNREVAALLAARCCRRDAPTALARLISVLQPGEPDAADAGARSASAMPRGPRGRRQAGTPGRGLAGPSPGWSSAEFAYDV